MFWRGKYAIQVLNDKGDDSIFIFGCTIPLRTDFALHEISETVA